MGQVLQRKHEPAKHEPALLELQRLPLLNQLGRQHAFQGLSI